VGWRTALIRDDEVYSLWSDGIDGDGD